LTDNRKVRHFRGHLNTFSILSGRIQDGGTCPGATEGEGGCVDVCYDCNLRQLYKGYDARELRNTIILKSAETHEDQVQILRNTVTRWYHNGGHLAPYFRIHTGGDFYEIAYAKAWSQVISEFPHVRFWAYTRSFFAVPFLAKRKNLTLYLSTDPVNYQLAMKVYTRHAHLPNVGLAWMGNYLPSDFPTDREGLVCPSVTKKVKSTPHYGACSRCRVCIDRPARNGMVRHVQFPIHR